MTRDKVTGTWKFVLPIAMKGKDVITKDGWKLIKSKSNDTWQIVYPKIVNGKTMPIINGTKYTFKLVKDQATGTWELVSPVVMPTGQQAWKHTIHYGNKTLNLVWNQTKKGWSLAEPHFKNGFEFAKDKGGKLWSATQDRLNEYFP